MLDFYFLTKELALAFALPLKQGEQDQAIIHLEFQVSAASSSFSRLSPSRVTFPSLSLRNLMKAIGYTYMGGNGQDLSYTQKQIYAFLSHNQFETGGNHPIWKERMECRYSWLRPAAECQAWRAMEQDEF
jgi:hypothetical protein